MDGRNVYISTQEFTSDLESFNGAQLYILPEAELTAGATSVHEAAFENLQAGGTLAFRVQWAQSPQHSPAEFAMSTLDPTGAGDNRIAVWAVTHRGAVLICAVDVLRSDWSPVGGECQFDASMRLGRRDEGSAATPEIAWQG